MTQEIRAKASELERMVKRVEELRGEGISHFLLRGDLASGKTTLVQAYVRSCGIQEPVTSPTFSLMHRYGSFIHHYDLYNKSLEELLALSLLDELQEAGIHFIEWGEEPLERLLERLGFPLAIIEITPFEGGRNYRITHA